MGRRAAAESVDELGGPSGPGGLDLDSDHCRRGDPADLGHQCADLERERDAGLGTLPRRALGARRYDAEFTASTFVGTTIQFAAVVDVDADGAVRLNGGVNGAANAASFVAQAFGAEVLGVDAAVASALLGSDFPAAAIVSPMAAQNALASNPLAVPEPAAAWLVLPVLAALGRAARAR